MATSISIDKMRSPPFRRLSEHTSLDGDMGTEDRSVWSGHTKTHVDQTVIRKQMSECIRAFIDRLPSDYKTVILLGGLEGIKD
jgi:DNA-directed RNA polymerase specialized sigma24 family protein